MMVNLGVLRTYQVVPLEVVDRLFTACKSGNFDIANKEVDNIVAEGYPASQIINQVFFYFPLLSMAHLTLAVVVIATSYTTLFSVI